MHYIYKKKKKTDKQNMDHEDEKEGKNFSKETRTEELLFL